MPKKNKKKKSKRNILLTLFNIFIVTMLVSGLIGAGVVYYMIKTAIADLPEIDPSNIKLSENSVILDSDGNLLEKVHTSGLRTVVEFDDMSENLINAYVAIEDKTFWEHKGFNFVRLLGAIKDSVVSDKRLGGTSTITQQLARNLYLKDESTERSIDRKIREAYYAIELEKQLEKEQIIQAYLNTIYLGSTANGVQAASQVYFSKDAKDLTLVESAILAGIPKEPLKYSPFITKAIENVGEDDVVLAHKDSQYAIVYNESCEERYQLVLKLMNEQGYITDSELDDALAVDIKTLLNPGSSKDNSISSFFVDMVKDDVIEDLMEKYGYDESDAYYYLNNAGLQIYSTIDVEMQHILESSYDDSGDPDYFGASTRSAVRQFQKKNGLSSDGSIGDKTWGKFIELGYFTDEVLGTTLKMGDTNELVIKLKEALAAEGIVGVNENLPGLEAFFDKDKNIVSKTDRKHLLFNEKNIVDEYGNLMISKDDYSVDESGNLVIENYSTVFYNSGAERIQVMDYFSYDEEHPGIYRNSNGSYTLPYIFIIKGGYVSISIEDFTINEEGNIVVSKDFYENGNDEGVFFLKDEEGNLRIADRHFTVGEPVIQPQSAAVIIDPYTGHLKAVVGGRNVTGAKILNRATSPAPPGSSIKPIAVYTPAIDSRRYTTATVVDDVPVFLKGGGTPWPNNWYSGYRGRMNVRDGIEQSLNVVAARIGADLGVDTMMSYLKKMGITTLVESGDVNDANLAALTLGGMSRGIPPVEMVSAYGIFPNKGVHVEYITYTEVVDNNGNVILENIPEQTAVVDEKVAWLVNDMMRTGVVSGVAKAAKIRSGNAGIPVAGKTGTTSNNYDAWFIGYTPYYVGGIWFGNDVDIELTSGSRISAEFFSTVMKRVHEGYDNASIERPSGIVSVTFDKVSGMLPSDLSSQDPRGSQITSDYFISGTQPSEVDDVHVEATVCTVSGKLATKYCPDSALHTGVFITRVDEDFNAEKWGSRVADQKYVVPTEECDVHTADNFVPTVDPSIPLSKAITLNPDGSREVVANTYVTLKPQTLTVLLRGTVIMPNNAILLPNGSTIQPANYYLDSLGDADYVNKLIEEQKKKEEEEAAAAAAAAAAEAEANTTENTEEAAQ